MAVPGRTLVGALSRSVWVVAVILLGVLFATSTRYGYHRDEMYSAQAQALDD